MLASIHPFCAFIRAKYSRITLHLLQECPSASLCRTADACPSITSRPGTHRSEWPKWRLENENSQLFVPLEKKRHVRLFPCRSTRHIWRVRIQMMLTRQSLPMPAISACRQGETYKLTAAQSGAFEPISICSTLSPLRWDHYSQNRRNGSPTLRKKYENAQKQMTATSTYCQAVHSRVFRLRISLCNCCHTYACFEEETTSAPVPDSLLTDCKATETKNVRCGR